MWKEHSWFQWHDQKFIVFIMCLESCFRDIILMNLNLVPRTKTQLGKKMSTRNLIWKLINNMNLKLILYCYVIKCSKFNAEAPWPIFVSDKKNWWREGTCTRTNHTLLQWVSTKHLNIRLVVKWVAIGHDVGRHEAVMLGGTLPGRNGIQWSYGTEGGNPTS